MNKTILSVSLFVFCSTASALTQLGPKCDKSFRPFFDVRSFDGNFKGLRPFLGDTYKFAFPELGGPSSRFFSSGQNRWEIRACFAREIQSSMDLKVSTTDRYDRLMYLARELWSTSQLLFEPRTQDHEINLEPRPLGDFKIDGGDLRKIDLILAEFLAEGKLTSASLKSALKWLHLSLDPTQYALLRTWERALDHGENTFRDFGPLFDWIPDFNLYLSENGNRVHLERAFQKALALASLASLISDPNTCKTRSEVQSSESKTRCQNLPELAIFMSAKEDAQSLKRELSVIENSIQDMIWLSQNIEHLIAVVEIQKAKGKLQRWQEFAKEKNFEVLLPPFSTHQAALAELLSINAQLVNLYGIQLVRHFTTSEPNRRRHTYYDVKNNVRVIEPPSVFSRLFESQENALLAVEKGDSGEARRAILQQVELAKPFVNQLKFDISRLEALP